MQVSVVVTVLNEAASLPHLLADLAAQSRPPDEVVICDGGSTDSTLSLLEAETRLPLRVLSLPGANISQGRNAAIEAAAGEIIVATDAGVRLDQDWVECIVRPLDQDGAQVVSGFFRPDVTTVFETAMGATVLPELGDIQADQFLPSSRSVAFRKSAWAAVGGYPEWLDYCEDLIFDFRLRDLYGVFPFVPQAVVYFRPRSSLRAFFRQYFQYARGDGKADLWRKRHAARYGLYLVAVPLIAVGGVCVSPWIWNMYLLALPAMFFTGWRRLVHLWTDLSTLEKAVAFCWIPIIRIVGDLAKMAGYPVGVAWRWRHRGEIPDWRHKSSSSGISFCR